MVMIIAALDEKFQLTPQAKKECRLETR